MNGVPEIVYDDPGSWPSLGALRSDKGSRRPPTTNDLDGRNVAVFFSSGDTVRFAFGDSNALEWEVTTGEWGVETGGGNVPTGRASVEVFALGTDLYVAHFRPAVDGRATGTLVLDMASGSAHVAILDMKEVPTPRPAVSTRVSRGSIGRAAPSTGQPANAPAPVPTTELVGKRVLYDYGDGNVYEHLYLTPSLFTWLCLHGAERGLADTESCAGYKVRDGKYLFTWREKIVPCGAAVVIDLEGARTCGAFFGRDGDSGDLLHFTWGAHVVHVESTSYPVGVDPSRPV